MSEVPVELIVAAFNDEDQAEGVLNELKAAKKEKLIGIQGAVVLRKDREGKIHTKDVGLTPGKGAAGGVVLGAVVGLLTGGTGLVLGALGAVLGGVVGKSKRESRFKSDRINQLAASLTPGSSAIVAVIEHRWVAELEKELEEAGADVMTAAISADIAEQLQANRDVAYSALASELGLETSRIAAGDDEVQVSRTSFSDAGVEHMAAVANEAGMAAQHTIETAEGRFTEAAAVTDDAVAYVAAAETDEGVAATGLLATAEEEEDSED
jgi:uncharacterized membrane protein